MGADSARASLRAERTQHDKDVLDLQRLLGDTSIDDDGVEHHGLRWLYAQVKQWTTVRSVGAAGGKPGTSMPFNADAVDFVGGKYWAVLGRDGKAKSMGQATDAELADETNYQPGFELTMVQLEATVRRALGVEPAARQPRVHDPLAPLPAVESAISWLLAAAPTIVNDFYLHQLVRTEAIRLIVRATGMMLGTRFHAGRSQCPHCYQPDSVISDEDRAFCCNPWCRAPAGGRHCWVYIDVDGHKTWVERPEPNVRGRGQRTDEELSRWAETG